MTETATKEATAEKSGEYFVAPKDFMADDDNYTSDIVIATLMGGKPVLMEGVPGTGKTAWVHQLAHILPYLADPAAYRANPAKATLPVEVIAGESMNPEDFTGYPLIVDGEDENGNATKSTFFATPKWAQNIIDYGGGILFLDELRNFPTDVHASLLKVIQNKQLPNGVKLPASLFIVAAQNSLEHSPNGSPLPAPLANRFAHFDWSPSSQVWQNGALAQWGKATTEVDDNYNRAASLVVSFIHSDTSSLVRIPDSEEKLEKAYPTWRSWQNVIDVLASNPDLALALSDSTSSTASNRNKKVANSIVRGLVGEETSVKFVSYVNGFRVPTYQELITDKNAFNWKESRNSHAHVTAKVLVNHARVEDNDAVCAVLRRAWDANTGIHDVITNALVELGIRMNEYNRNKDDGEPLWRFSEDIPAKKFGTVMQQINTAIKG